MSTGRVGALSLLALGVNGVVGVGIFFTPNLIAALVPGGSGALVYLATGALLLPVALTFAALGTRVGLDGGPYVWARAAFGESAAFAVGWVAAVSALLSTAAVIAGLREHLAPALHIAEGPGGVAFAWGSVALLSVVAAMGLRPSAWTWNALTCVKLLPIALLLLLAFVAQPGRATEAPATDSGGFGRALLIAVFPLQGFEAVPVLAGSARGRRAISIATLGSLSFACALYALIQLACVSAVPDLAAHAAPLAAAAERVGGPSFMTLVSVGTNVSALATAFGMIVMTPRYIAALGASGRLGALDARQVPQMALWGSAVVIALLASSERLGSLFIVSSSAVLLQYLSAMASLGRLALRSDSSVSRLWLVPALASVGAVAFLARAVELREVVILSFALLLGAVVGVASARATRRRAR